MRPWRWILFVALFSVQPLFAQTVSDLRAEFESLRKDLQAHEEESAKNPINDVLATRYGPDATVVTQNKLKIGGLLQIWFQSPQKDKTGNSTQQLFFPSGNATPEIRPEENVSNRNDVFRIRRTELHFSYDINEHISAFVMLDPARESSLTYYPLPTFPKHNSPYEVTSAFQDGYIPAKAIQPHILQDCYINVFGVIPHHTITIGQFKPPAGEEAFRNSGQLDFVERAMVTGINNIRDDGAMVSGTWWDDRFKYSLGAFNGPSGTILSDPEITEAGNRADDNNEKDFAGRISARPFWDTKAWSGRFELGYARTEGVHGGKGQEFDPDFALNALNRQRTAVHRQAAWAWYRPNGPVKGWWLRGEWGTGHDRFGSGALTSFLGIGSVDLGVNGPRGGNGFTQQNPSPVDVSGWFFSTGYYMPECIFVEDLKKGGPLVRWLTRSEFAFRYQVYQNIAMENLVNPDRHTDLFKTEVFEGGLNYYIEGRGVKLQANYLFVHNPTDPAQPARGLRQVHNNVFVVNFQESF